MKNWKKLVAMASVVAMSMTMGVSAFAENAFTVTPAEDKKSVAATAAADWTGSGQYTVVIAKAADAEDGLTDSEILYINQGEYTEEFWGAMGTKTTLEENVEYLVRVGGENLSPVKEATFTIVNTPAGPTYTPGDCDGYTGVTPNDATAVAKYLAGTITFEGDNLLAANCDGYAGITPNDATAIAKYLAGSITELEYAETTN